MFLPLARKAGLIHVLALGQAGLAVVPVLEDRRHGEGGVVYKGTLSFHSTKDLRQAQLFVPFDSRGQASRALARL